MKLSQLNCSKTPALLQQLILMFLPCTQSIFFLHKILSNHNCVIAILNCLIRVKFVFVFKGVGVHLHFQPAGGGARQSLQRKRRVAVMYAKAIMTHHSAMQLQIQNNTKLHYKRQIWLQPHLPSYGLHAFLR